jgi:hypothetical protein
MEMLMQYLLLGLQEVWEDSGFGKIRVMMVMGRRSAAAMIVV